MFVEPLFLVLITCSVIIATTKCFKKSNNFYKVNNLAMHVLTIDGATYLLDHGALCSKQNYYSWIDYTILPELIKTGGITTIDTLALYKPSKKLVQIAAQLAQQTNVKTIFVTTKCGCYHQLSQLCKDSSLVVKPIYSKPTNTNF